MVLGVEKNEQIEETFWGKDKLMHWLIDKGDWWRKTETKESKPVVLEEMVLLTEIGLPGRKADFLERWQGIQFQSEF